MEHLGMKRLWADFRFQDHINSRRGPEADNRHVVARAYQALGLCLQLADSRGGVAAGPTKHPRTRGLFPGLGWSVLNGGETMALRLDADAEVARDLAKRCVPEGGVMGMGVLLQALFHGSSLKDRFPQFGPFLPEPEEHRKETPASIPLAAGLKTVLTDLVSKGGEALTPPAWFAALLESETGRDYAITAGFSAEELDAALQELRGEAPKEIPRPRADPAGGGSRKSGNRLWMH